MKHYQLTWLWWVHARWWSVSPQCFIIIPPPHLLQFCWEKNQIFKTTQSLKLLNDEGSDCIVIFWMMMDQIALALMIWDRMVGFLVGALVWWTLLNFFLSWSSVLSRSTRNLNCILTKRFHLTPEMRMKWQTDSSIFGLI